MNQKTDWNNVKIVSAKPIKPMLKSALRSAPIGSSQDNMADRFRREIMRYNDVMMDWLNESKAHQEQYVQDPVRCFKNVAKPDASMSSCLEGVSKLSKEAFAGDNFHTADKPLVKALKSKGTKDDENKKKVWDMIASIRLSKLNCLLSYAMKQSVIPNSLQFEMSVTIFGTVIKQYLEVTFGSPKLSTNPGSSLSSNDAYLNILFPILSLKVGNISYSADPNTPNMTLSIEVLLNCVSTTREDGETEYHFYLDFSNNFINSVGIENYPEELKPLFNDPTFLAAIIKDELIKRIDNKKIEICSVGKNKVPENYKFLVPSKARYILKVLPDPDNQLLNILMLTTSLEEGTDNVNDNVVPQNCDGSITLSSKLFMENVMKKAIATACCTKESNFSLRPLDNASGNVWELYNIASFSYKEIKGYTPKVTNLTFSDHDNLFYIHMDAEISPTSGIVLKYYANGTYKAAFSNANGNVQSFVLKENTYDSGHHTEIEWWVYLVAALATVVAAWTTGILVGTIAAGLSFGAIGITDAIIESCAPDKLKSSVFTSAVGNVSWSHADILTLRDIGLYGDIQLGWNISFIE